MIKVCGMREPENIREVSSLPINLMGGIFYHKSPRFLGNRDDSAEAFTNLPDSVKSVGVFVNAEIPYLSEMKTKFALDYLQLHGSESISYCSEAQKIAPLFKAFGISDDFDFSNLKEYEDIIDLFIFDTSCKGYGGSGKKFNWDILENYIGSTPFLLSGGITNEDVDSIKALNHSALKGVDLNSGFESEPALKNVDLLEEFVTDYLS